MGSTTLSASAAYGSLFASALANVVITPPPVLAGFSASAIASFKDTLTVFGGSGVGSISYFLDGSVTNFSDEPGTGFTFQQGNSTPEEFSFDIEDRLNQPFQYQTAFYQFSFGVPFTPSLSAQAITGTVDSTPGSAILNLNLDNIVVLNQNGQPISFSISSQSGAAYPGAVPGPSSLLLGATLVVLTGGILHKRRRRTVG